MSFRALADGQPGLWSLLVTAAAVGLCALAFVRVRRLPESNPQFTAWWALAVAAVNLQTLVIQLEHGPPPSPLDISLAAIILLAAAYLWWTVRTDARRNKNR